MQIPNQRWFDQDSALHFASGGSAGNRNGGIDQPAACAILPGTLLVRFTGDSEAKWGRKAGLIHEAASGSWWLEYSDYLRVEKHAIGKGIPIQKAMRELCQIVDEWNDLSQYVVVRVTAPLLAYIGAGGKATGKTQSLDASKALDGQPVNQLYIPGLGSDARRDAMLIVGTGYLKSDLS